MTTKQEGLIERVEDSLSKNPQVKQAARTARNLFDDAYGCVSHAGREINNALDGLPKKGEMSPAAKAVKAEWDKNCETATQVGTLIGNDFRTYGVPMLRDGISELSQDKFLLGTAVVTAGCAVGGFTLKNPYLLGAAAAGVVTGELYVVSKPTLKHLGLVK